jgi:hypothetical protein
MLKVNDAKLSSGKEYTTINEQESLLENSMVATDSS